MQRTLFEDEHRWFRESVAAFVAQEILPWRDQFRADGAIPRSVWLKAGEMGFLGLGVSAESAEAVSTTSVSTRSSERSLDVQGWPMARPLESTPT